MFSMFHAALFMNWHVNGSLHLEILFTNYQVWDSSCDTSQIETQMLQKAVLKNKNRIWISHELLFPVVYELKAVSHKALAGPRESLTQSILPSTKYILHSLLGIIAHLDILHSTTGAHGRSLLLPVYLEDYISGQCSGTIGISQHSIWEPGSCENKAAPKQWDYREQNEDKTRLYRIVLQGEVHRTTREWGQEITRGPMSVVNSVDVAWGRGICCFLIGWLYLNMFPGSYLWWELLVPPDFPLENPRRQCLLCPLGILCLPPFPPSERRQC